MNVLRSLQFATRYLLRYSRRYVFLLLALGFGFGVITVMTSLREGMSRNVAQAAQNHYSGHLFVLGFDKQADTMGVVDDDRLIMESVEASGIRPDRIVRRTVSHLKGILFFQGTAVRHKDIFGIDFDEESELFASLDYASGSFDPQMPDDGVIISAPVAEELRARVGDRVTIQAPTRNRQINTGFFTVTATVNDKSIFGYYKAYVKRTALNRLLGLEDHSYSSLGLYFDDRPRMREREDALYAELTKRLQTSPPIRQKEDLTFYLSQEWQGVRYFTFPLAVYVSQVADLLSAMTLVSYVLYVMIMLIVLAGALVTYSLIIHERTTEIGTMRALGMHHHELYLLLLLEALVLFLIAAAFGVLLAVGVNTILSLFSYDWIPGFEIFLRGGVLKPHYSVTTITLNFLVFAALLLPLVTFRAGAAARVRIADALSGDV